MCDYHSILHVNVGVGDYETHAVNTYGKDHIPLNKQLIL